MVFPAVMYGFESWTINKAEHQRIDAFKLWYWRRFLRVPWIARKLNQSILKESKLNIHWKDWCWRGFSNFGYFGHLIGRANSLEKTWCWERLRAAGERNDRGKDGFMASLTQRTWVWANPGRWWRTGKPGMLHSMGLQIVGHDWVTEHQHVVGMQKYLLTMTELNIDKVINSPGRNWSPLKEEAIWKCHTDAAYHESFSSPFIFPVSIFPKRSLK